MKNSKTLFRIIGVLFALVMVITLVSMKPTKASSMTFTVSYDANGGTNAPAKQSGTRGYPLKLTSEIPTRDGYKFVGWSTSKNGELEFAPGGSYNRSTDVTLYAKWQANIYYVYFDANGGSNAPARQVKSHGTNITIKADVPTRTGHTFAGWATKPGGGVEYVPGSVYSKNATVTFYAVWQPIAYAVKYYANGGSNPPANQTKYYGINLTLSSVKPTRTGYSFVGWSSTKDGNPEFAAGGIYDKNANVNLYAKWQANLYYVNFDANGGKNAPARQVKSYGSNITITTAKPTRDGYTFQGWSTTKDGAVVYAAGATYSDNKTVTLYAKWKLNTYTIKYDANGGSGAPSNQTKTHGTNITLSSTKPTRSGYVFKGWSTVKDGAVKYAAGAAYTANEAVTLYAKWVKTYTVSYVAKDASNVPAAQTKEHGVALTLSKQKPTKTGYTFVGWSSTDGGELEYAAGGSYTKDTNITLYAKWQINTYAVTFNTNGGSTPPAKQTKTYGQTLKLTTTVPTRSGFTFMGWATSASGSVAYAAGGSYTKNEAVTLYAVWAKNYAVTYNANGGSGAPANQTKVHGVSLALQTTKPGRTGYTFQGWAITKDGAVKYAAGATYTANEAVTLYAVWTLNTYSVKYDANGGSGAPGPQTKTHGTNITLSSTKPTRTGFTFVGWASKKDGTLEFAAGGVYDKDANVILYAKWQANIYYVNYDANGGSNAPARQVKSHGTSITLTTAKPNRTGYTFHGWSAVKDGAVKYTGGETYTDNKTITLYAVWKLNEYTIKFDANGGTGAPGPQTKTHGTNITLSSTKPTRTGFTFVGWASKKDGTLEFAAGGVYDKDANVILYAKWQANIYYVNYDANGGTDAPARQAKSHGTNITLTTAKPDRTGYTFKGWATSKNGSVVYAPGATYKDNKTITLYAIWAQNAPDQKIIFYSDDPKSGRPYEKVYEANIASGTTEWTFPNPENLVLDDDSQQHYYDNFYVWTPVGKEVTDNTIISPEEKVNVADIPFVNGKCEFYAFTMRYFINYHIVLHETEPEFLVDADYYANEVWTEEDKEHEAEIMSTFPDVFYTGNEQTPFFYENNIFFSGLGRVVDISWIKESLDPEIGKLNITGIECAHFIGWTTDLNNPQTVYLPGEKIDIKNHGKCVDLYALWAPKEIDYFRDEKPSLWLGTDGMGNPCTVIYLTKDQVGTGSIAEAVKGASNPDLAWKARCQRSFASAIFEKAESDSALIEMDAKYYIGKAANIAYDTVEKYIDWLKVDGIKKTLQNFVVDMTHNLKPGKESITLADFRKIYKIVDSHGTYYPAIYCVWGLIFNAYATNVDPVETIRNSLVDYGIVRTNGVIDESAKPIRIEINESNVVVSLYDPNSCFRRKATAYPQPGYSEWKEAEGVWCDSFKISDIIECFVPDYSDYYTKTLKESYAQTLDLNNSTYKLWVGKKNGLYCAVAYLPRDYIGTGTISDAIKGSSNPDEAWAERAGKSIAGLAFELYERRRINGRWINTGITSWNKWVEKRKYALKWDPSLIRELGLQVAEGAAEVFGDAVYNRLNESNVVTIVDFLKENNVRRSAGIVYFPKGTRIEVVTRLNPKLPGIIDVNVSISLWDGKTYDDSLPAHDSGTWCDDEKSYVEFVSWMFTNHIIGVEN